MIFASEEETATTTTYAKVPFYSLTRKIMIMIINDDDNMEKGQALWVKMMLTMIKECVQALWKCGF